MIKLDLINEVVTKTGVTKTKAEMAVECVFESMKRSLARGDRIELRGFGVFTVRPRTDPVFWSAVRVAAKPASWSAPSWNAVIRRSASGSGPRTSSPARRRGCRRCSFSGNLGLHEIKPPSASCTNCG